MLCPQLHCVRYIMCVFYGVYELTCRLDVLVKYKSLSAIKTGKQQCFWETGDLLVFSL